MRALIIQHNETELPGVVGARLRHHGVDVVPLLVSDDLDYPDPSEFDLIVPLGAPESVNDADVPWIPRELEVLGRAVDAEVPTLGICFGAQMLAHVLGADVRRGEHPEIGWTRIDVFDAELMATDEWFELHFDVFSLPPGARELARNDTGPQAFSMGQHLGVQFHPEITAEILTLWVGKWPSMFADLGVDGRALIEETRRRQETARQQTEQLIDVWLARLDRSRPAA